MKDCKIACLIMASGISERFGGNKLLASLGDRLLVDFAISAANLPLFCDRILVTRLADTAVHCESLIHTVKHDYPTKAEAVRLGVESLIGSNCLIDGIIFLQADQPFVRPDTLAALCEKFSHNREKICRLSFKGEPASPVIFPKSVFDELMNIEDGKGGAFVIKKHPDLVECFETVFHYEMFDIDTIDDMKEAEDILKTNAEIFLA